MTIAPFVDDEEPIRESFRMLQKMRDELQEMFTDIELKYLSMGMSADYRIAIEEGAHIVRIGTAVFGERTK